MSMLALWSRRMRTQLERSRMMANCSGVGVHLGPELEEEAHERVPAVVGGHVQRRPAVVAFGVDDVAAKLGFQHQAGDARSAVHRGVVKRREAADKVLHRGVSCTWESGKERRINTPGEKWSSVQPLASRILGEYPCSSILLTVQTSPAATAAWICSSS
ncbi:hypothetical protein EYF80_014358 [Liparis tanakae]|uniref:Uncharacterized protein n=1 Tax=Liparis tanakae TaxID=230148 RepID=A0A4Z2IC73_9TELE|nr:hypothetical protein EYF80_014358 [Liparis tanakae]